MPCQRIGAGTELEPDDVDGEELVVAEFECPACGGPALNTRLCEECAGVVYP